MALINNDLKDRWDILLIQEPHTNYYKHVSTPAGFRQVYPDSALRKQQGMRSAIWVNADISTNSWRAVNIPNTTDVTAMQLDTNIGTIHIFNIYNDCNHDEAQDALDGYMIANQDEITSPNSHILWCGDFNRHHPLWDNDAEGDRLFTNAALARAERLIQIIAKWNLCMLLPKGDPTLQHWTTGSYSRPDNVFGTEALQERMTSCKVLPGMRPPKTDHYPIGTIIDVTKTKATQQPRANFLVTDWDKFNETLKAKMEEAGMEVHIGTREEFTRRNQCLMQALQETVNEVTPVHKPYKSTKRWWTQELTDQKKVCGKLRRKSYNMRGIREHPIHAECKIKHTEYAKAIIAAKKHHWGEFLERSTEKDLWISNGYLKSPVGDGGRPRMPTIKKTNADDTVTHLDDNTEKAEEIARTFFPPPTRSSEHKR